MNDLFGDVISCTLWEAHVIKFLNYYNNQPSLQPLVILLTNARVKEGQDNYINSTCNVLTVLIMLNYMLIYYIFFVFPRQLLTYCF
ncbi:hypothetical protein Lalb_Chr05g0226201 [Lupinus albus]|uniref:Uncharacterized protein n=1 Tax=Lupinus albus TaxID=3870 RepID=A0A6A4QIL6_LUPAL|nr:hypothetical protein Lalb_Chr05g0226201 [Lupinus albus]